MVRAETMHHPALVPDRLGPEGVGGHAIAAFAGQRHTDSTLQCIYLSGRDLADKLVRGMDLIHAWRVERLTAGDATAASR